MKKLREITRKVRNAFFGVCYRVKLFFRLMKNHTLNALGLGKKEIEGVQVGMSVATSQVSIRVCYANGMEDNLVFTADSATELGEELINTAKIVTLD